jgi:hypothetical protein
MPIQPRQRTEQEDSAIDATVDEILQLVQQISYYDAQKAPQERQGLRDRLKRPVERFIQMAQSLGMDPADLWGQYVRHPRWAGVLNAASWRA